MTATVHRQAVIASLASLMACAAGAQSPAAARPVIELSQSDVFFISRWFRGTESKTWSALCGFAIHGNYRSDDVPRPEWELNIQELMAANTPVFAVTAAAFEVVSKDSKAPRQPHAAISALAFTVDGSAAPVTARIVGQPGGDNAIKAVLDTQPAHQLLAGFYDGVPITISLGYQDGGTEVLKVSNLRDRGHVSGHAGYLRNCTERLHPLPPGTPSAYRINSPLELMSQDPFATHE
jgi:hypothetical protein